MKTMQVRVAGIAVAAVLVCAASSPCRGIGPINSGWRFAVGDKAEYAAAAFDDSGWEAIKVDRIWEEQGMTARRLLLVRLR